MSRGKIPSELLQKIKSSVDLLEIIGEQVVLRKSGASYLGLCPFHIERTPSFYVHPGKQLYHCYGCKKGGDAITFLMDSSALSFNEAVEELAERGRIPIPAGVLGGPEGSAEDTQKRNQFRERQALAFKLNRFVASFFHQNLMKEGPARAYLESRGMSEEWVRTFYIGCTPPSSDGLIQHLKQTHAPMALAEELGLVRSSYRSGAFDGFRNRVVFPILNLRGKVAGFGGRILGDENPKYLNSPESFLFQKSKLAFGLFQAQKFIREKSEAIWVEGYFDVFAMHAAGFRNTVATCGTALSVDHLKVVQRIADRMIVLFDGDEAGRSATERAMELGLDAGFILYGVQLPKGLDPDEYLARPSEEGGGGEQMAAKLQTAQPLLDQKIAEAAQNSSANPEERIRALKKVAGWLARLSDRVGREARIPTIEKLFQVSRPVVLQAMQDSGFLKKQPHPAQPVHTSSRRNGALRPGLRPKFKSGDLKLISALAAGCAGDLDKVRKWFGEISTRLPEGYSLPDLWENQGLQSWIREFILPSGGIDWTRLNEQMTQFLSRFDPEIRSQITQQWAGGNSDEEIKHTLEKAIGQVWAQFSQRMRGAIERAEASKDAELEMRLMKEYLDVQRKMKDSISFYDEA